MRWIISRYNHDVSYLPEYTDDYMIFDRSEKPLKDPKARVVDNIGSDIYDKFKFIIMNYENLPEVAVYTKANIFKYITKEEFDKIKDNKTFTPILTQNHKVYEPVCRYNNGIYEEINNLWYLGAHPTKFDPKEVQRELGVADKEYLQFAPGSNYILPRENILKKSKEFYQRMLKYLEWAVYPGEAQIIERGLYNIWK